MGEATWSRATLQTNLGTTGWPMIASKKNFRQFQLSFPEVDFAEPVFSSHGRYVFNLHLALVHDRRWCHVRLDCLAKLRFVV